jgi:hypothetical protein
MYTSSGSIATARRASSWRTAIAGLRRCAHTAAQYQTGMEGPPFANGDNGQTSMMT